MGLLHHDRLIVGYDLGEQYSQISYCITGDYTVETLSSVAGEEDYNIPTVLCKRVGANQWYYGREALRCAEEGNGILVDHILQMALDGEPVVVDEVTIDPVSLLSLFLKRSLGILAQIAPPEKLYALMITCEKTDARRIEVLKQAAAGINLKEDRVFFQDHTESYYNYMLHQPEELWQSRSLLFEYRGDKVIAYCMECNQRTSPVVAYTDCRQFEMSPCDPLPEAESPRREKMQRMDRDFMEIAQQACGGGQVGAVYLIGEGFSGEWMKESLRFLCRGRRVFQGDNLYSKGACLAMLERLQTSEAGKQHVFLGSEKLKANIGMKVLGRGEETYLAMLDAGVNWFEARCMVELYVQDCDVLELQVISLIGQNSRLWRFHLEGLPAGYSRIQVRLYMGGENRLVIEAEDLGFGNFRPATHRVWKQETEL